MMLIINFSFYMLNSNHKSTHSYCNAIQKMKKADIL
jgi:hypothetical protein